ncbi:hypothetical protein EV426DRAFT_613002 [Tirmania nivea]|nr:hypothetical protein EV426DRAFT_613002 [Tirmania nivea]
MSQARYKILNERGYRPLLRQSQTLITKYLSSEVSQLQGNEDITPRAVTTRPQITAYTDTESDKKARLKSSWKQIDLSNLIKGYRLLWIFSLPTPTYPQQDQIRSTEELLHETQISLVYELPLIRCYDEFRWLAESQLSFPNTISIVRGLQRALDEFSQSKKCSAYDAEILSIYEEIATLLLFLGWPEEIIIPNSWRELHLSYWTKALTHLSISPYERREYQYLLYHLVLSFCKMITWLENQVNTRLNLILQDLLTRRGVDFLLIILLNFKNLLPSLSLYWTLYPKIREVLRTPALRAKGEPSDDLLASISQALKVYTGKDYLCLNVWESQRSNYNQEKNFLPNQVHPRPTLKCVPNCQPVESVEIAGSFRATIDPKASGNLRYQNN